MKSFQILSRKEKSGVALVSAVATAAVLGAVLLTFADDGSTPWFSADSHMAAQLVRCASMPADSNRHQCIREVAAVAQAQAHGHAAVARK